MFSVRKGVRNGRLLSLRGENKETRQIEINLGPSGRLSGFSQSFFVFVITLSFVYPLRRAVPGSSHTTELPSLLIPSSKSSLSSQPRCRSDDNEREVWVTSRSLNLQYKKRARGVPFPREGVVEEGMRRSWMLRLDARSQSFVCS